MNEKFYKDYNRFKIQEFIYIFKKYHNSIFTMNIKFTEFNVKDTTRINKNFIQSLKKYERE